MISVTQFKSIKYYSHYLPHQLANKIDKYIILEINKEAKDGEENRLDRNLVVEKTNFIQKYKGLHCHLVVDVNFYVMCVHGKCHPKV